MYVLDQYDDYRIEISHENFYQKSIRSKHFNMDIICIRDSLAISITATNFFNMKIFLLCIVILIVYKKLKYYM